MRSHIIGLLAAAMLIPGTGHAQSSVEGRVGRLESEMRAVQRKVFPGGAGQTVQPEIEPPAPSTEIGGVPATSAVADLTGRVTTLEQQLASMTDQIEQNGHRIRQLEAAFEAYKRANPVPAAVAPAPVPTPDAPAPAASLDPTPTGTLEDAAATTTVPRPTSSGERPAPIAAVPAGGIEKPATGDTPEDEYIYGYRLWAAKRYPEAEAQFKKTVAAFPKHRRASFAQNLLGRSYLDEGKPSLASIAFYDNYKKMPDGERAPESLYYLAQALIQLKKPADACKVYGELEDVYGTKISAGMKADVAKGRAVAKCG